MGFFHRLVVSVALASGVGVLLTPAHAQKRVALVIGNDRYAHLPALRNAVADARAIGQVLEELGFRVFKGENLEFRGTNRLHADFEARSSPVTPPSCSSRAMGLPSEPRTICCQSTCRSRAPARRTLCGPSRTAWTRWCAASRRRGRWRASS